MSSYILSCCSTADLSEEHLRQRDIAYVCFHFELDGEPLLDDLGKSMPPEELFRRMGEGAVTKTSHVSVEEYVGHFEPFLKEGKDIFHVTLSSGISDTYRSAQRAAKDLQAAYPDRKIFIVDSLAASSGYGLLMDMLADLRERGMEAEELYQWTERNKLRLHHWFFSTDLTFYIRGGRISRTAGFIGTMLNICPLLNVNRRGQLTPREKIRTKKKVMERIVELMKRHANGGEDYQGKCYLCHSMCYEDAREVADLVAGAFPYLNGKPEIYPIGAAIGSHTGLGTVALFFWGDERNE